MRYFLCRELNGNLLKTLSERTFYNLHHLKQLDLSNNPWECDCRIFWLKNLINNSLDKSIPIPKCDSPINLQGKYVTELDLSDDFQCQFNSPIIEIQPGQSQVVFEGDSITLKCSAPSITDDKSARLNWLWNSSLHLENIDEKYFIDPREKNLSNIKVENRYLSDSGIIDTSLNIHPVKDEHNGQWNCQLISIYGNKSKTISIIVISEKTIYCPLAITSNNKGVYAWPRTVIGWKVELPCEGIGLSSFVPVPVRASYECNSTGNWINLNTESCPFISPTTKAFEQYSKVNLSLIKADLLATAKRFKDHAGDPTKITDPIEIHFIAKTIENYLSFLVEEKELDILLIDVISAIMNLSKSMLTLAEINYNACTRLIKSIETITEFTQARKLHKKNLVLEEFRVKQDTYFGITCTWYSSIIPEESDNNRVLNCANNNKTASIEIKDKTIEASIQLPASLIRKLNLTVAHQLMVSMYISGNFFPFTDNKKMDVTTAVIGSKVIGLNIENLTEPVYVVLKMPRLYYFDKHPIPVIWDVKSNESGKWSTEGCHLVNYHNNLVVFHCDRLGYYGLLEDTSYLHERPVAIGAKFKYSNPAIYVGTFVIICCLTCTSVTYIICNASIIMSKKAKHSVVNTWIAITFLCFLYSAGIQQTESIDICQGVGMSLHYLSLCCLLWMTVSANNMYKRLSKSDIKAIPDDEIAEQPIQKPILGLYLVGWGIAMIICGISGAINLREYAGYYYCFLSSKSALVTLFVPGIILLLYMMALYLLIRCAIRSVDHNGQLSEGTQAIDLELLEPHENRADQNSIHSTQTVSSEVEDVEHSPIAQLKGQVVMLILYLIVWTSGAASTVQPFKPHLPGEELIFSILYAVSSSCLGLFVLLFYGIARSDVRSQWTIMRCWLKRKKNRCCRTRSVCDAHPSIPAQPLVQNLSVAIPNTQSIQVTSDQSITNSIASSRTCNPLKKSDIESDTATLAANKNKNLVVLHRQQYRSNNSVTTYTEAAHSACVEMFYNPHQSGVARKFFKKQRRHTKHNNLGPRKQGDGGVTSDNGSSVSIPRPAPRPLDNIQIEKNILGSNAKVNNTNIHVEMNPIKDTKNINILSDSGGSMSGDQNVSVRYVIGHDNNIKKSRKKMNNNSQLKIDVQSGPLSPNESDLDTKNEEEKDLRNVSQQCSLEYNSELDIGTHMISERSDHDLPEIGETPETPTNKIIENIRCSSLDQVDKINYHTNSKRLLERSEQSNSLFCLSDDHYGVKSLQMSYRNSYNDVPSISTSSKNCEADSRASIDDLRSEDSSEINSRNCAESQQSETDENSLTSESMFNRIAPLFTASLSNINCMSMNLDVKNDVGFGLVDEFTLENSNEHQVDLINRQNNHEFLEKSFSSLTDLTANNVSLGETRHLDMNASIGVDYEDINYTESQNYDEDDVALDEEEEEKEKKEEGDGLLDKSIDKKETSV